MATAYQKNAALAYEIQRREGVEIDTHDAAKLRRAGLTLHRWAELECGDGNDYASWCLERDEATGVPYMVTYPHTGKERRHRIADREAGALRTVREVCARVGLHWYHQGDPRGAALRVSREALTDMNYNRGVAV